MSIFYSRIEKKFLGTLMASGFGEAQMRQIIENKSLVDPIKNYLVRIELGQRPAFCNGSCSKKTSVSPEDRSINYALTKLCEDLGCEDQDYIGKEGEEYYGVS